MLSTPEFSLPVVLSLSSEPTKTSSLRSTTAPPKWWPKHHCLQQVAGSQTELEHVSSSNYTQVCKATNSVKQIQDWKDKDGMLGTMGGEKGRDGSSHANAQNCKEFKNFKF